MNEGLGQRLAAGVMVAGLVMAGGGVAAKAQASPGAQDAGQNSGQAAGEATSGYKPKFAGDPARSDSEAQALGYMRVVLRAQRDYKKRHDKYAESLAGLAGTGSFTKRMAQSTDRGDYKASFRTHHDGFVLTMTPNHMDSDHRSFYAEDDMAIHADDEKAADAGSPKVK